MLGSFTQNELEAVREIFGMGVEAPIAVSTAKALGEMFAAGPILNTAIGLSIPDLFALPRDILPIPAPGRRFAQGPLKHAPGPRKRDQL